MADTTGAEISPKKSDPTLAELVRQLQALPTYAARKEFYFKNPSLAQLIDPANFAT